MIDRVKIYVKAGDGGSGCNSFKGTKFSRSRHPDGGGAGNGGDVIIKVDHNIQGLEQFQFKQHFRAKNGKSGQANKKKGANGRPYIIKVPIGTVIRDLKNNLLLQDLTESNAELLVAKGGEGGKGNTKTKSATAGTSGEEKYLLLELKLVADIGIIGYPNSGKSTFLAKITYARPKIASYPFTTTRPFLGILEFSDFVEPSQLTVVEIPALIKGAHEGKGLGIQFLRHAERTRVLIHLVDLANQEGRNAFSDYQNLNQELKSYSQRFSNKTQILVANKMDLPEAENNLKRFASRVAQKIYPISALTGRGIEQLLDEIRSYFSKGMSGEEKFTG